MTDYESLARRVDAFRGKPARPSQIPQDSIPLLSKQIASARDSTSSDDVRSRAEAVLEQLAVLYAEMSSPP
ncbi:hypothetical protein ACIGGF_10695 [Rhodococcus sp. NPDC078407]|uniref:hypothetical protein n=1 Tax=Rhodococcus sp. NPDC078407 TaxID=3364509 RepID=UPI0037C9D10B